MPEPHEPQLTRGMKILQTLVDSSHPAAPVHQTLRLGSIEAWGDDWVRKTWRPSPEVLFANGGMFGGYLAALADQMQAFATYTVLADEDGFTTTNLQVSMVGRFKREGLLCEARIASRSRRLIVTSCEMRRLEDNVLIAVSQAHQMIIPIDQIAAA
jgi:acyl-coenzyme A thioesterase PaaI-like protein